ncbi:MAG: DUF4012 domain-containing protein [Actinomycetota bacterium]
MKRRIVLAALGLLFLVGALCLYVALSVAGDLRTAQRTLLKNPQQLDAEEIEGASDRLDDVVATLGSLPARLVGWLPIVRQNFDAVRTVAEGGAPVLRRAGELSSTIQQVQDQGVFDSGAVDLEVLTRLEEPLRAEGEELTSLIHELESRRNGWLVPALWSEMGDLLSRLSDLETSTRNAADMVALAPQLLGKDEQRTYLVALMNNTELRGAGGILSGVGSVTVEDGRMSLGKFSHYKELADEPPYRTVPAPPDFEEHFGSYKADTTRWVTATSSPDLPDVALVASRLFELTAGEQTDGVIFVDPRGLAALMPPAANLEIPTTDRSLTASELPQYVYRDAYKELGGGVSRRRDSLIGLGRAAFEVIFERGFGRPAVIRSAAEAFAGGHLSVVAFAPDEAAVLERVGLSRELAAPEYDGVLATVQNVGGNKLDSYARRRIHHGCEIDGESAARCVTRVSIENLTPRGLTRFEYQYLPYGLFKNVVEIYVPEEAELVSVAVGDQPADFFEQPEDGFSAIGLYLEIPKGQETEVSVAYDLPAENRYELEVVPQPLVEDALLSVDLEIPATWSIEGPDGMQTEGKNVHWKGGLDRILRFRAGPSEASGLSAWWQGIDRFLDEPVL